jgi:hypothetical protein|tara:strand:+ start:583 stop:903 length:321 start_codon:yes stop_codon:yes gene_type:complete
MKKIKTIFVTFSTLLMLNACGSVIGDNRKGSDEFLVEKKAPLVLPPSFGELPEPDTKAKENVASNKESSLSIEDIIGQNSSADIKKESNELSKSIEKSIIEKINEQ